MWTAAPALRVGSKPVPLIDAHGFLYRPASTTAPSALLSIAIQPLGSPSRSSGPLAPRVTAPPCQAFGTMDAGQ
ncbi:hypothetical protein NMY22_g18876 [Coprinellus aureogranulatus]|nr:hypothetical protein NMY22_g18876 [Coprinellus aureogranulatus]